MFINYYNCPKCGHEWQDTYDCQPDDDCPECGERHVAPFESKDVPKPSSELAALAPKLASEAEAKGIEPESLDEAVHEAKSREASAINNEGLEAQIGYLLEGFSGNAGAARKFIWDLIEEL